MYGIRDNNYVELSRSYGAPHSPALHFTDKGYLHMTYISGAGSEVNESFLKYTGGTILDGVDSLYRNLINQTYSHNSTPISSDEYEKIRSQYGNNIDISFTPVSNITDINNYTSASNSSKPTAQAYIEEINGFPRGDGSSFVLHVNGDYSYYYYEGYYTGGGSSDHICKSGTTSDESVELTAGSVMSQVRAVVIPYYNDGTAGDSISISYKPEYAKNRWNAGKVIACTFYGEINAPGGGPINGYTTSYLVNGGPYSCERVDLMDKWHVTAVNFYSINNDIWYELYDTDDGDYYGWVNQKNFTFY